MRAQLHTDWRAIPDVARGMVAALGNFDGVHLGHAHLVHALHAARPERELAVVTFEPHPRELFRPQDPPFRLTLEHERFAALAALGVKHVFQIGFDREFSAMSAEDFVTRVLHEGLGLRHVACGLDFAFGHRRRGNVDFLAERTRNWTLGLRWCRPFPMDWGRIPPPVSAGCCRMATPSARPRNWVAHGRFGRGAAWGQAWPPAGLSHRQHSPWPPSGTRARRICRKRAAGRWHGAPRRCNIGRRPTINDGQESRLEVHLLGFAGDLYGQSLSVALHTLLRAERRFDGLDALKAQIARDSEQAAAYLSARHSGAIATRT